MTERKLAHSGVLGMHWGRHLAGRTEESHNPKPKKQSKRVEAHQDHVDISNLRRNPTKTLSTAEIKKVNERLQTEKKYKDLDPKGLSKGAKILAGVVAAGGTAITVYNMYNSPAGKIARQKGGALLEKAALKLATEIVKHA